MSTAAISSPSLANATASEATHRLLSVDVLRGLCVAGMVLVTNVGSWEFVYWPLKHADWNGATPTDMIFPSFVFLVGVAMTFSFASREGRGQSASKIAGHVLARSLGLIVLGVLLNCFDLLSLPDLRLPGVLQRIGLCYCFGGLLYLGLRKKPAMARAVAIVAVIATLTTIYWWLQTQVSVPGYGVGRLDSVGTFSAYLDRAIFSTKHLWHWGGPGQMWDPEGLLSTLPAIGNLLMGVLTGEWLRRGRISVARLLGLIVVGIGLMLVAFALNPIIPINKKIWTPSFLMLSGGLSLLVFTTLYWLIDRRSETVRDRWRKMTTPAAVFGGNAMLGFALANAISPLLALLKLHAPDGRLVAPSGFLFQHFERWLGPWNASLAYACLFVLLILALLWPLHRRRIFLRL